MNPDVIAINARQAEVEAEMQVAANAIKDADMAVVDSEKALNHAKAEQALKVPFYDENGNKLLAAERELKLWLLTEDKWYEHRIAEIAAEYARNQFKALDKELIALCSRANRYMDADKAHARFGGMRNA